VITQREFMLFSSCIPSRARTFFFFFTKCPNQLWAHPVSHSVPTECPFSGGGLRCRSVKLNILRNLIPKCMNALRCTSIAPPYTRNFTARCLWKHRSTVPIPQNSLPRKNSWLADCRFIGGFRLDKWRVISYCCPMQPARAHCSKIEHAAD
jgi:hypothetical protein